MDELTIGSDGTAVREPVPTADLTVCDREPIQVPGAIQQHGLLLIADDGGAVLGGAGALAAAFGADWRDRPIADLIGQPIPGLEAGSAGAILADVVSADDVAYDATLHRAGDRLLIELEPAVPEPGAAAALAWLDGIASAFGRASDLGELCARAAVAFRTLTGFDRVMVYRFLDDEAGRVVAEDRAPTLGTFMHHHFPATDIPAQARALYVRNRSRVIPDIAYRPAPIEPASEAGVDLSDVGLRSVSPIHLEYLANMGVRASASFSIVKDGLLWGLIACHHNTPRHLSRSVRASGSALAGGLARQIGAKEEAARFRERLRLRAAEDAVVPRLATDGALRQAIADCADDLQAMLDGDGFAYVAGSIVDCHGHCPPEMEIVDIARWARGRAVIEPFATRHLAGIRPGAEACARVASGLLAMPLADSDAMLLWFRAEEVEEVEWAGNPHKAVALDPNASLTPRTSFETWTQAVHGRSRRWTLEEVEAAHRLRRALHDAQRTRQLRALNRDLTKTLADKEALLVQKDLLMREVDHRVQNSLQLVAAFLSLQAREAGPGAVADQLAEARSRLSAVALVHRRLYRDDQIEAIDLSRYLDELAGDLKQSLGDAWAKAMRLDLHPVLVPPDRAVNIGLVMTELVINATKYAYGGAPGPVTIGLEQHRDRFRLIVADQGRGKGDGAGFGSRMMTAVVSGLHGTLDLADNRPGLRAILTAPIEDQPR